MRKRSLAMLLIVIVIVLAAGCTKGNENLKPEDVDPEKPVAAVIDSAKLTDVFGFADAEGKQLIVTGRERADQERVSGLNKAVGENGKVLPVTFVKWQEGSDSSNGREMAHNFDHLAGFIFKVEEGAANPDGTYYLVDGGAIDINAFTPITRQSDGAAVAEEVKTAIAEAKGRAIANIWHAADIGGQEQLYVAQFERRGSDMLFSIVLKRDGKLVFMDYPAVMRDETSVWRVDDGGEVTPDMFKFLFAANTADGLVIGVEWLGAEGSNAFLLQENGVTFKESEFRYSRYTSPI